MSNWLTKNTLDREDCNGENSFRDVCDIIDGPHATPTKTESGPVYLGIDAITEDGRLNEADFAHLSVEDYKKWTRRVTPTEGDIVFSYEATLGRYAVIPKGFMAVLVGGLLLSVTEAKQSILSGYIIIFVHPNGTHL